jgi:hypothetical protein
MTTPGGGTTSDTARLLGGAPSFAVGWQEPVYVPLPAAGAQWSHKIDGRWYERVMAVRWVLTTSAVVASRFPDLVLTDPNGMVVSAVSGGSGTPASSQLNINLAVNGPAYANGTAGDSFGFMPDLLLAPGWSWGSTVVGMDVADQLSGVVLLVQRFPSDTVAVSAIG